ncbi:MAG: TauD/TfdA family dioxygenase [Parachlamydia sp.]|nr:TauD/TfdA family dioxygenase [Parachlamydia sp.]
MEKIKTKVLTLAGIPLAIEPAAKMTLPEFYTLLKEENAYFRQQLLKYGALLFRGFPIASPDDFAGLVTHLNVGSFVHYIGGDSPRKIVKGDIYTSTEAPPSIKIPLHNELSFVKNHPRYIHFYCETAPQTRGETIIADARKVYATMNPEVRKLFADKGLRYVSRYYYKSQIMNLLNKVQRSHKSWSEVFETHSKEEVEKICHESEFELKWNRNDWLQIAQVRPAVMAHPDTNEMVWFNQAHLFDFNPRLLGLWRYVGAKLFYCRRHTKWHEVSFADGTPIPRQALYHVMDVLDSNTVKFPWQKGDVMVQDNVLSMHGRETFNGPRRILTAMTA